MELTDRVAVVTGAASGIGRALAWRLAEEGARGVVVADLDEPGAQAVADGIGARALAVGCDVSHERQVVDLVRRAEDAFGPVDLFCANAGVAVGTDLDTPEEAWELAFGVNVRAHVYAAKALVPGWLERGEGYFLATASAAGLLTQIGSAPYSVTKHAALAFAEWLSVTYGDRGLRVSCLCPMGVRTGMTEVPDDAPDHLRVAAGVVAAAGDMLEPEQVAHIVVDALRAERFLILPHPEVLTFFQRKADDYDRWLAGMRRLQARVTASS
ncbi:MAG TPA: SDR family oxidoreductase [Solirubrobacteraceae bacterium]|nr:SDR family oxidoreductase [Solirubrobacteraceae bacterium]